MGTIGIIGAGEAGSQIARAAKALKKIQDTALNNTNLFCNGHS